MHAIRNFFRFWRIYFIFFGFGVLGAALISRLFFLQIQNHGFYRALAQGQHNFFETLTPLRGEILFQERTALGDKKFIPVAVELTEKSLVVSPREVTSPERTAILLSEVLGLDRAHMELVLRENNSYAVIKQRITEEEERAVKEAGLRGVYIKSNYRRHYPDKEYAAHVLGFVGEGEEGQGGRYGVEQMFNSELAGKRNRGISSRLALPKGADAYLTIDYHIQLMAEKLLKERVALHKAQGGEVVVMDPGTGAVIAMAAAPSFDPNAYFEMKDFGRFLNPVTQEQFEPGSVFKPFTIAAAIEEGKVTPSTVYYDKGYIKVGIETIKNFEDKVHNEQTVAQILEKSINTGVVYISQLLGGEELKDYLAKFGFGERTGIDLPGEIKGDISNLNDKRDIHYATASFGQGIAVTPIQLLAAFSVFANGGESVTPFLLQKMVFADGSVEMPKLAKKKRVLSPQTAQTMNSLLIGVVENGTAKRAQIKGYFVAGKTGTAQVSKGRGQGYGDETIHSFIGYAPATDPKFIILVKIDSPIGVRAAEGSAVPLFRDLAEYIINYYAIPPDNPYEN